VGVENSHVRFLGNLVLNLWDCGGQDAFMENYFESQRDQIFRNVEVLIYVLDAASDEKERDLEYYQSCVEAIKQNSRNAHIFCLIHKMDLVEADRRDEVFAEHCAVVESMTQPLQLAMFRTSIWDETLYKAWSSIVYALVPNVQRLEKSLTKFCDICQADEAVLFEKSTFLVISQAQMVDHPDVHRFEKISNIIKQFKLSCSKSQAQFQSMQVKSKTFTAFIYAFTANTYIMVIMSNLDIQPAATLMNINAAKETFEKMVGRSGK
jgi:Ras-related GTP-binding protein A/B